MFPGISCLQHERQRSTALPPYRLYFSWLFYLLVFFSQHLHLHIFNSVYYSCEISTNLYKHSCKTCCWSTRWTLQEDQKQEKRLIVCWVQTCFHSFVFHFGESFLRLWINRQPLSLPETHRFLQRCPRRLRVPVLQTLHDWLGPLGSSALSAVTAGAQGQHDEFSCHFNYATIRSATHSAARPVRGPQLVDGVGRAYAWEQHHYQSG